MTLHWHHTEFGRRTDDQRFRIVRQGTGWQLLDANWDPLARTVATIPEAQQMAERLAARARVPRPTPSEDRSALLEPSEGRRTDG